MAEQAENYILAVGQGKFLRVLKGMQMTTEQLKTICVECGLVPEELFTNHDPIGTCLYNVVDHIAVRHSAFQVPFLYALVNNVENAQAVLREYLATHVAITKPNFTTGGN